MTYRYEGFGYRVALRPAIDTAGLLTGQIWGFVSWQGGIPHSEFVGFMVKGGWPFDVDFILRVRNWLHDECWVLSSEFTFTPRVPIAAVDWDALGSFVREKMV